MSDKDTYIQKQEAQLEEWQAKIDLLKAKAKQSGADTKINLDSAIQQIEAARDTAKSKIDEMRGADDSTWGNVKNDVQSAVDNLRQAIGRVSGN